MTDLTLTVIVRGQASDDYVYNVIEAALKEMDIDPMSIKKIIVVPGKTINFVV